jgi:predicted nucleic acid-binding Zn ribbon protein
VTRWRGRGHGGGPKRVGDAMPRLLQRLGVPASPATLEAVFARWDEVVEGDLGSHVRPLRVDGSTLVVAVDHSAWATRARMQSAQILAQVRALGGTSIERLEVLVERP